MKLQVTVSDEFAFVCDFDTSRVIDTVIYELSVLLNTMRVGLNVCQALEDAAEQPEQSCELADRNKELLLRVSSKIREAITKEDTKTRDSVGCVLAPAHDTAKLVWATHNMPPKVSAALEAARNAVEGGGVECGGYVLWFASKALDRDQALAKYFGTNNRTKAKVQLRTETQGRPATNLDSVSARGAEKDALAAMHKRSVEEEKLAADEDTSYLTSEWANPRALKASLHGTQSIKWKFSG